MLFLPWLEHLKLDIELFIDQIVENATDKKGLFQFEKCIACWAGKKKTNKKQTKPRKKRENTADCDKIFKDKYQVCVDFLHDPRQIEELKPMRKKCKH